MKIEPVPGGVTLHTWLIEPLAPDVRASLRRLARAEDIVHIAVMPDVHVAGDVCIGTVVATRNLIYPAAVGGGVGCGMVALALDCGADLLTDDPSLHVVRRRDGAVQFATLGRGNHFFEFQGDEDGRLWLAVHSGSRAMGPAISDLHLSRAEQQTGLIGLAAGDPLGRAYLHDVRWARRYAAASRRVMLDAVIDRLEGRFGVRADVESLIECDHNHVVREQHFDQDLWVHRKGAAPAGAGVPGIIPGSMGTASFHTLGRGETRALRSSSHGAGRALPRESARRRVRPSDLVEQMRGIRFDERLATHLVEESPQVYKDIATVMRAQRDLTRIVRRLRPLLVYKA